MATIVLKFKETADYSQLEDSRPAPKVSGEEAYQFYLKATLPQLEKAKTF